MNQLHSIETPTFYLPDFTPGELDYMAQAHTEEMYAFVHLFRQHSPSFGLPATYALNSFYQKKQPHGKIGTRQQEQGQQLRDELVGRVADALIHAGWTQQGISLHNGKTPIWQPPLSSGASPKMEYNKTPCQRELL